MTAIDTLKVAQRFQDSGFSKKQAAGAAEILADVLEEHPRGSAVIEAVQESATSINRRIDASERRTCERIDELKANVGTLKDDVIELKAVQSDHTATLAQHGQALDSIQTMLGKILEGQAVLLQNDMELRRQLKDR